MNAYIDRHRDVYGVESCAKVLQVAPSAYRQHARRLRVPSRRRSQARRDEHLMVHIQRVWQENHGVYGADKVWRQLNREGITLARCTVERLMRIQGLQGVRRGKRVRTTIADETTSQPLDRVNRQFHAERQNQLWVLRLHLRFDLTGLVVCMWLSSLMSTPDASLAGEQARR